MLEILKNKTTCDLSLVAIIHCFLVSIYFMNPIKESLLSFYSDLLYRIKKCLHFGLARFKVVEAIELNEI